MSPIDSWDDATYVFTGGPDSFTTVVLVLLGLAIVIGFFVTMVLHEKHAYQQMLEGEPVEKGPAVEGEPTV